MYDIVISHHFSVGSLTPPIVCVCVVYALLCLFVHVGGNRFNPAVYPVSAAGGALLLRVVSTTATTVVACRASLQWVDDPRCAP